MTKSFFSKQPNRSSPNKSIGKSIELNKESVYQETVNGKRVIEIARQFRVTTIKINYYRRQLIKDGRLVFHKGVRPVPKDPEDRVSFWVNRIMSWHGISPKERVKIIAKCRKDTRWLNLVTSERQKVNKQ